MIKKIVIEVGKKQIELTDEQARELWADLDQKYGQSPSYIPYPVYPSPYYYPSYLSGTITTAGTSCTANTNIPTTYTM